MITRAGSRVSSSWRMLSQHRAVSTLLYSPAVEEALENNQPVVALESTIITHGMPYPENLATAKEVEDVVLKAGATPATIAIYKGQIHVGLSNAMLEDIASMKRSKVKVSRRDLAVTVSQKLTGGTTVAGTMIIAEKAGIDIFVTGGIGGVHRGAETTMDISADLIELGRTPVTVVSAGIKSILDIEKTLEYLETQGVCVVNFGDSKEFPCFFTKKSGFHVPWNVSSAREAADLIISHKALRLRSGILIANPIPDELEANGELIERSIREAIEQANQENIRGKDVTPYILSHVHKSTDGVSLKSNIGLVKHNALIGSRIARNLCEGAHFSPFMPNVSIPKTCANDLRPVVIGGAIVDFNIKLRHEDEFVKDIETYDGRIHQNYGGVARNIADCLARLGLQPLLITAIGNDSHGKHLLKYSSHMETRGISVVDNASTATCVAVHGRSGLLFYNIADMHIHNEITESYVLKFEKDILAAPMIIIDGNIPEQTCSVILDICSKNGKPVWFEPTSNNCSTKPFMRDHMNSVWYTSPNSDELEYMYRRLIHDEPVDEVGNLEQNIRKSAMMARSLLEKGFVKHTVFATLGENGLLRVVKKNDQEFEATHFESPQRLVSIRTANGAGDCQASAIISGISRNLPPSEYMSAALNIPLITLKSYSAVPETICPADLSRWQPVKTKLIHI